MDDTSLIFDPDEDDEEFFFHGAKQTHRDITKRVKKKLTMDFDNVFNEDAINTDIFEKCMKPLVNKVMEGFNCSVFVYGATGAGKTYTMLGSEETSGEEEKFLLNSCWKMINFIFRHHISYNE